MLNSDSDSDSGKFYSTSSSSTVRLDSTPYHMENSQVLIGLTQSDKSRLGLGRRNEHGCDEMGCRLRQRTNSPDTLLCMCKCQYKSLRLIWLIVWSGPCITNVFATRRKNFSQWHRSFQRKLLSHWLKFLRHVAITLVIQGPAQASVNRYHQTCCAFFTGVATFLSINLWIKL